MRWLGAALASALVVAAVAVAPAAAGTTAVPVSMTLVEVLTSPAQQADCPDIAIAFNCGVGVVVPFGVATEEVAFGEGCGGACDSRVVTVASGSLFLDETASDFSCPGACAANPPFPLSFPFRLTLTDVVVGGTGIFDGASGRLTGSASISGPHAQIKLSGTVTLDP